jgi:ApaG protein
MYRATTRDVSVEVKPQYLGDQSDPERNRFFWSYNIRIENHGGHTVRLLHRHWRITDALGHLEEVKGPGVVGKQPLLEPGQHFEYTSGVPLSTASGIMTGTYEMVREDGELFDVEIPAFSLDIPSAPRRVN